MNCVEEKMLHMLADGELDHARARQITAHMETCEACREAYAELSGLSVAVKTALEAETARVDLTPIWAGVSEHIRGSKERVGIAQFWMRLFQRPTLVYASSTVAVILAFALIFLQIFPGQNGSTEAAVVESIDCDDPDVIIMYQPPEEGQIAVVYVTGLENSEGANHENSLP